jgi:hypothetical protein
MILDDLYFDLLKKNYANGSVENLFFDKIMPPLAPISPPLGDGAQYDNPNLVAGNSSSSQWGYPSGGRGAPRTLEFSKKIFTEQCVPILMTVSGIPSFTATILIIFLFTSGCTFSRQSQSTYDNSTYLVKTNDSTITLAGKYIVDNDTYWIRINPITNYLTYYSAFNITAQTNLPVDENVLIRIYNATPGAKGYGRYSITGNISVTNGESTFNKTTFHVNQFTLSGPHYIVLESAGEKGPSNVTHFEIWPTP